MKILGLYYEPIWADDDGKLDIKVVANFVCLVRLRGDRVKGSWRSCHRADHKYTFINERVNAIVCILIHFYGYLLPQICSQNINTSKKRKVQFPCEEQKLGVGSNITRIKDVEKSRRQRYLWLVALRESVAYKTWCQLQFSRRTLMSDRLRKDKKRLIVSGNPYNFFTQDSDAYGRVLA